MKRHIGSYLSGFALPALAAVATIGIQPLLAQDEPVQLNGYYLTVPYTDGTPDDALAQSVAGATIPMTSYALTATKDGKAYKGVIVGGSPPANKSTTTDVVVIPLKFIIGSQVFDPSAANSCDGNISALNRLKQSPLVEASTLHFNGVSEGSVQYTNGFMRAEFQSLINSGFEDKLAYTYAGELSITAQPSVAITFSSGCSELAIISYSPLASFLSSEITALQKSGVIKPTQFVLFLVKNLVQSTATPPTVNACCILGYHTAQGSPVQTWGIMDWDTSGDFGAAVHDATVSSHEIAEWMNDPLGNNATPAWGNIGQVSGCQGNFEVGDPLSGTNMPTINLNGYAYHVQELAFFSWYFNKDGVGSYGAGGKFSGNGKFKGPSKACPPGGTF